MVAERSIGDDDISGRHSAARRLTKMPLWEAQLNRLVIGDSAELPLCSLDNRVALRHETSILLTRCVR